MMLRAAVAGALVLAFCPPADAHELPEMVLNVVHRACGGCTAADPAVRTAFEALERTGGGVSYADARNEAHHPDVVVEVGSFFFSPRVLEVDPGQVVRFVNTSPSGGNRHVVASSDPLGPRPVLPVPGASGFGGGTFTSGVLQPGGSWDWPMEAGGHPGTAVPLGIDKVVIPYHCNLHGAGQMNGFLLLRTKEY